MAKQDDIDFVVGTCRSKGVDPRLLLPAGVTRFEDLTERQMALVTLKVPALLYGPRPTTPAAPSLPPTVTSPSRPGPMSGGSPISQAQDAFLQRLTKDYPGGARAFMTEFTKRCGGSVTSAQASAEIKRLQSLPPRPKALVTNQKGAATTTAPAGRYAVEALGGIVLVEVTKPTEGNWAGYTFLKTVPVSKDETPGIIRGDEAVLVLNEIESDRRYCAARYGRITGRCGQCNRRLRDQQGLSLGIGPDCLINFS